MRILIDVQANKTRGLKNDCSVVILKIENFIINFRRVQIWKENFDNNWE